LTVAALFVLIGMGCGDGSDLSLVTEQDDLVADVTGYGPPATDPTYNYRQAEAVINVSNVGSGRIVTVTYNDATDNALDLFRYTETTREVLHGASLMGWSYSTNGGASFTYGGKVNPPPGWAIFWGDPAIASYFENQNYVFIANIAVSEDEVPPGGSMIGSIESYIDGACIARSTDGGVSFQFWQCVTNDHFYDGTSLAIDNKGDVWFATRDYNTNKIDVYRAVTVNGTFLPFADPFPGKVMWSHPRLRAWGSRVYLMAQDSTGQPWITRRNGSGWTTPFAIPTQFPVPTNPDIFFAGGEKLRTGYQFAFDVTGTTQVTSGIGSACPCTAPLLYCSGTCQPRDHVRVIYGRANSTGYDLHMTTCDINLTSCATVANWSTNPPGTQPRPGEQFNPVIHTFPGFLPLTPTWRAAWLSREEAPTGGTVSLRQAAVTVVGNLPVFLENPLVAAHDVCADDRGFWGDYNDIKYFDPPADDYITVRTDSSLGCPTQWEYTSHHAHVESVIF
jgi:hypothetical protein